jgi:hypothetical protein
MLVVILKGPQLCIADSEYMLECISSICHFLDDEKVSNGSRNKTTRRQDTQSSEVVEDVQDLCEQAVNAVTVSRDGRWVATVDGDAEFEEIKACKFEMGTI